MDAEPLLLRGYQGLSESKGTPPEQQREALERLVQLYTAWGQTTKADEWRRRLDDIKKPPAKLPKKARGGQAD